MRVTITIKVDYDEAALLTDNAKDELVFALENNIDRHIQDDLLMSMDFPVDHFSVDIE